jgi:hypothetical protein
MVLLVAFKKEWFVDRVHVCFGPVYREFAMALQREVLLWPSGQSMYYSHADRVVF